MLHSAVAKEFSDLLIEEIGKGSMGYGSNFAYYLGIITRFVVHFADRNCENLEISE